VTGQVLEKPLDQLKQMVLHYIHFRPGQTTEAIVKTAGGVLTKRECEMLLASLQEDGLIKLMIPGVQEEGGLSSAVLIQG
jgi:hypothetical protein